jgi:hypothetical protein
VRRFHRCRIARKSRPASENGCIGTARTQKGAAAAGSLRGRPPLLQGQTSVATNSGDGWPDRLETVLTGGYRTIGQGHHLKGPDLEIRAPFTGEDSIALARLNLALCISEALSPKLPAISDQAWSNACSIALRVGGANAAPAINCRALIPSSTLNGTGHVQQLACTALKPVTPGEQALPSSS